MDLKLKGKRALVTGSSSGLGEAIAHMLAAEGVAVVVHGRDERRTRAAADAIRARDGDAEVALGDLATDEGAAAVARVARSVDILVNNAGAYRHGGWHEVSPRQWADIYETNVISAVRMIRHLVPGMRERRWGRVITIGGGLGIQPLAALPDYNASLAARHNLAVSLARDLQGTGVTSNVVAPGAIRVKHVEDFVMRIAEGRGWGSTWDDLERAASLEIVPNDIGRFGRPEEIAAAVAYLASANADYVSGEILRVDGGTVRSL